MTEPVEVLPPEIWRERARTHHDRVDAFTAPHRDRARRGESHPVWDFLFSYYSLRPRQLRVWHPGYGVALAACGDGTRGDDTAEAYLDRAGYVAVGDVSAGPAVAVSADHLRLRLSTVRFVAGLLESTAARSPNYGCFGMHEWAMVYRAGTGAIRHARVPLRLGRAGTDAVVESMPLRCSHFDAYRFFTPAGVARNQVQPTRATQSDWEQPGCLHANMDLYKWSYKLSPLVDSALVMDCLELAAAARQLDMQASPYDLTQYGMAPIPVEEPAGRAEYARRQAVIAARAAPLRAALRKWCERLMGLEFAADKI